MKSSSSVPRSGPGLPRMLLRITVAAITSMLALIANEAAQAQTFNVLYTFTNVSDGDQPGGRLLLDPAGNLYGTTVDGGFFGGFCASDGCGLAFTIDPTGNESVLYSFNDTGTDGEQPRSGLTRDPQGNLYGTTELGGNSVAGTAFVLDPNDNETILHSFTGGVDGGEPTASLLRDSAGNLYGTTKTGGSTFTPSCQVRLGCGVIFGIDVSGEFTLLHSFTFGDGAEPATEMIRDAEGNLYGVTAAGGEDCNSVGLFQQGCGVVYIWHARLDQVTMIHRFNGTDGGHPFGPLAPDGMGNFYGTTSFGGAFGFGNIFKVNRLGDLTVVHNFRTSDGGRPLTGVVRDSAGNLYGATGAGIFKVDPSGNLTLLHIFAFNEGVPGANLIVDQNGNLYGTTQGIAGGPYGEVFKLTP